MMRFLTPVLVLAALVGCTAAPPPAHPTTSSSPPAAPVSSASTKPGRTESDSAAEAGVDLSTLGAPIACGRVPASVGGDPAATMEVCLFGLRRSGTVLSATFSFRVATRVTGSGSATLLGYLGGLWAPYLVDTVNLNRHDVLTGGGVAARSGGTLTQRFAPGSTLYGYAMFAAPPDGVTTMDVQIIDGLPTATNVPIR